MDWQEIYTKHKDTELMKEFIDYWYGYFVKHGVSPLAFLMCDIKDIWGYLICFAETKKEYIQLEWDYLEDENKWLGTIIKNHPAENDEFEKIQMFNTAEQAMLWCADKFFEVAK